MNEPLKLWEEFTMPGGGKFIICPGMRGECPNAYKRTRFKMIGYRTLTEAEARVELEASK